ncbi:MAG: OmpA family protein [Chitinophagales bacterium]
MLNRHISFALLLLILIQGCATTQKTRSGSTSFDLKEYAIAAETLQKEFNAEKDPTKKRELANKIADSYRRFNNIKNAAEWYAKAVQEGDEQSYFNLGKMQLMLDQPEEAIKTFTKFGAIDAASKNVAQREIKNAQNAIEWKQAFTKTEVHGVAEINTPKSDYAPVLLKGNLIFTSSNDNATGNFINEWTGEKQADLYSSEKKNGKWSTPQNFSPVLNTAEYEGSCTFSKDGNEIYFTRCKGVDESNKKIKDKKNEFCKIYFSRYANGSWAEAEPLNLFPDTVNVGQPALSRDGKTLFVSSDMKAGFGGHDLYYFSKTDSGWSAPANAGQYVNTSGDEYFPWLDDRGNLYFASNGLPGMGGLDIFKATRSKTLWKDPQNLRYPINSGADDFAFIIEKYKPSNEEDSILMSGYFSSSRQGGRGGDDIYHFEEKWRNTFVLKGKILTKQFENPENPDSKILGMQPVKAARVDLKNPESDAVLASVLTDGGGNFTFPLQKETDYKLTANAYGFFSKSDVVSSKGKRNQDSTVITIYKDLELEKIFTQKEIVIPNIYYDYDKAALRPESKNVLDSILVFFNENKDLSIEIGSHTDSRGSDAYNQKLSQARAQSVVDYLIGKGVAKERLVAVGYGETKPVNNCTNGANCTEEEFQKNRRTTFRITGSKQKIESVEPENITVDPKK